MSAAATAISAAIRVSRPQFYLAGREDIVLGQGLLRMSVCETVQGLYHCEACFGNWGPKGNAIDFLYFDRKTLDFGTPIQIKVDDNKLFDGRISALEGDFGEGVPPEIAVLLEDRFEDMRMTRRTRTFENVSDSDVMTRIASDYGLQANINVSGTQYQILAQVNQSDLAFLRERARSIDAELWLDGRTLNVESRPSRNDGTVKLNYGGELREARVTADLAGQRTAVSINGWDIANKSALTYQAVASAVSNELNGGTSGISILQSAFGERKESLAHTVPLSSAEAHVEADGVLKMMARKFVVVHGVAQGNAKLNVGTYVNLGGLGPLFSGKYYVASVKHTFDGDAGFLTAFTGERPAIGGAS